MSTEDVIATNSSAQQLFTHYASQLESSGWARDPSAGAVGHVVGHADLRVGDLGVVLYALLVSEGVGLAICSSTAPWSSGTRGSCR